ncbi:MAG: SBBP repeat-containing protein [Spirochaetes bacterium]|nr:SBBP repeat-containing protein [Spirochaetota bacterium]
MKIKNLAILLLTICLTFLSLNSSNIKLKNNSIIFKNTFKNQKLFNKNLTDTIPYDIALDSSGNIYLTGYTNGNLDGQNKNGTQDLFLIKFNSSGDKIWTIRSTGADTRSYNLTIDSSDNIFLTGWTDGNLNGQIKSGSKTLFLIKYNSSGIKQWIKLLGVLKIIFYKI